MPWVRRERRRRTRLQRYAARAASATGLLVLVTAAAVLALAVRYEATVPERAGPGAEPEGLASGESAQSPSTSADVDALPAGERGASTSEGGGAGEDGCGASTKWDATRVQSQYRIVRRGQPGDWAICYELRMH